MRALLIATALFVVGRAVAGGSGKTVNVWHLDTGRNLLTLRGHSERVTDVAYSPKGRYLLSAGIGKTARVWDAKSGAQLFVFKEHTGPVTAILSTPDGRHVITCSTDHSIRKWLMPTENKK